MMETQISIKMGTNTHMKMAQHGMNTMLMTILILNLG